MLVLYYLLQFSWGIIQNILGFFLFLLVKNKGIEKYHGAYIIHWNHRSSLSLGIFIFFGHNNEKVKVHEYGHSLQSMLLGPMYLLVIGLPSFLWACLPYLQRLRRRKNISYFDFYCEKWASALGEKALHEKAAH